MWHQLDPHPLGPDRIANEGERATLQRKNDTEYKAFLVDRLCYYPSGIPKEMRGKAKRKPKGKVKVKGKGERDGGEGGESSEIELSRHTITYFCICVLTTRLI